VSYKYDLVGVNVHSGQSIGGHYYAFIKDKRGGITNPTRDKWVKFNDTTVEEVNLSGEEMVKECFGGQYRVTKQQAGNLPEERTRYWSGYILYYEARQEHTAQRTPKKSFSGTGNRRSGGGSMGRRLTLPPRISEPGSGVGVGARESLSQLSDLLEKGEQKGLFSAPMPPSIQKSIAEENTRFMQNRDVFSEDYFAFVQRLVMVNTIKPHSAPLCTMSLNLAVHFLFNTYFHVKKRKADVMDAWLDSLSSLFRSSSIASSWFLQYLSGEGEKYLEPFLVSAQFKEIRTIFSSLISSCLSANVLHSLDSSMRTSVLRKLLNLLPVVLANVKQSASYFSVLLNYAKIGSAQSQDILDIGAVPKLLNFLLGVPEEQLSDVSESCDFERRKWSSVQNRELGDLHTLVAFLVLQCANSCIQSTELQKSARKPLTQGIDTESSLVMPKPMHVLLSSPLVSVYINESLMAIREVAAFSQTVLDMLAQVSSCLPSFSSQLVLSCMTQYNTTPSSELTNLSNLVVELLAIQDHLQNERIKTVIEGTPDLSEANVNGLLDLVKNSQNSDSSRAYQAVKCLVTASSKCSAVKDHLILEPTKWQWAVNWLKSKMSEASWNPQAEDTSNEESASRVFHRTTSAQVTLDEANAMLAEFETDNAMDTNTDKEWDLDAIDN